MTEKYKVDEKCHVYFTGGGTVDGQGLVWWQEMQKSGKKDMFRPHTVNFVNEKHAIFSDTTFINGPNHILELYCDHCELARINIFNLYSDFGSNFSGSYPPQTQIIDSSVSYRESHCVDLTNVRNMKDALSCKKKYLRLIEIIHHRSDETDILDLGCKWVYSYTGRLHRFQFHKIDCGCGSMTFPSDFRHCKPRNFLIDYIFYNTSRYSVRAQKNTKISISQRDIKVVTTTQSHAMKWTDLLAQIGGYLGLLTGVSVITLVEFIEFGARSTYRKVAAGLLRRSLHVVPFNTAHGKK